MTALLPHATAARLSLTDAWRSSHPAVRTNSVIPIIIVVAIVVLLALGATVVIGAVALCAANGGVLDSVVNLSSWEVRVTCHKL